MKIGIFGSAFNPPTKGHYDAIMQTVDFFDEIWLVPSYKHGFGKNMLDYDIRVEMLNLFVKNFKNKVKVCDIEKEIYDINHKNSIYTYDLLNYLKNKFKHNFKFICGPDNAAPETWSKFYKSDLIDEEFGKFVVKDNIHIRSTLVRDKLKNNEFLDLENYIFPNIEKFIIAKKLYT